MNICYKAVSLRNGQMVSLFARGQFSVQYKIGQVAKGKRDDLPLWAVPSTTSFIVGNEVFGNPFDLVLVCGYKNIVEKASRNVCSISEDRTTLSDIDINPKENENAHRIFVQQLVPLEVLPREEYQNKISDSSRKYIGRYADISFDDFAGRKFIYLEREANILYVVDSMRQCMGRSFYLGSGYGGADWRIKDAVEMGSTRITRDQAEKKYGRANVRRIVQNPYSI